MLIYVDDLIICRNHNAALVKFKTFLGECFHMKGYVCMLGLADLELTWSASLV